MKNKFNNWRNRVKKSIKPLIVEFFSKDIIPYEEGKRIGFIIKSLYDPYYDILDDRLNDLSELDAIPKRICLEIAVKNFYESMLKIKK